MSLDTNNRLCALRAEPKPPRWAWLAAALLSALLWLKRRGRPA